MKGAVTLFGAASDALGALASRPARAGDAVAVLVEGDVDGARVRVAAITAFGASVWESPTLGTKAASAIVVESLSKGKPVFAYADRSDVRDALRSVADSARATFEKKEGRPDDVEAALAKFRAMPVEIPASAVVDGEEMTRSYAVAVVDGDTPDPRPGDKLRLAIEPVAGCADVALRWRREVDGLDCGLHAVLPRAVDDGERDLVRACVASVMGFAYGRVPAGNGQRTTRLVTVLVPCLLARAFTDGRLPKYNVLPADLERAA